MNRKPFKSFSEYLDSKGKLVEKPDVKTVATFDDTPPSAPEKVEGQKEKPSPYSNPVKKSKFIVEPEDGLGDEGKEMPKTKSSDDSEGLGHEGDEKLVYEPKVSSMGEWSDKTKNLKVSELAKAIAKDNTSLDYDLHMVVKETVELCKNKKFATVLKSALKNKNII